MSDTPLKDALDKLGSSGEGLDVFIVKEEGARKPDFGAEVTKEFGKNKSWSVSAGVQYVKEKWAALGKVSWRPRNNV